ncbi:hypothetical protein FQZ97_824300 [compost metagenome]
MTWFCCLVDSVMTSLYTRFFSSDLALRMNSAKRLLVAVRLLPVLKNVMVEILAV